MVLLLNESPGARIARSKGATTSGKQQAVSTLRIQATPLRGTEEVRAALETKAPEAPAEVKAPLSSVDSFAPDRLAERTSAMVQESAAAMAVRSSDW